MVNVGVNEVVEICIMSFEFHVETILKTSYSIKKYAWFDIYVETVHSSKYNRYSEAQCHL